MVFWLPPPQYMVFWPSYTWYFDLLAYLLIRNGGGGVSKYHGGSIYHTGRGAVFNKGVQYMMDENWHWGQFTMGFKIPYDTGIKSHQGHCFFLRLNILSKHFACVRLLDPCQFSAWGTFEIDSLSSVQLIHNHQIEVLNESVTVKNCYPLSHVSEQNVTLVLSNKITAYIHRSIIKH
jgi:hypothetical protein